MSNLPKLRNEITTDPLERGYAQMSDAELLVSLTTADRVVVDDRQYTIREYFRRYGPDEAMVAAIQAASPTIGAMITDFGGDGGLDFSTDDVRDAIDALVSSVSALTVVHGANLKALGWRTISRAEELGLGDIYIGHVQKARAA